ncbi:response regulator [Rhodopila sp.]|uniref:response regulator n=1 Tax=Rhodopila sp. TaxID=2480087 RepID=UPI003D14C844
MTTVLVVEDEFGIAELISSVLTDEGYRVLLAVNGKQGLELLTREHPDLVFTDYMMPVMDGAGMLHRMAEDALLSDIPVVVMSSIPEATVAERCTGYAAFMLKPFRIIDVVALTKRLISKDGAASD